MKRGISLTHVAAVTAMFGAVDLALGQSFTTGFEAPGYTAAAGGISVNGQSGWFTPGIAGSIDQGVFTYAGNSLGLPLNRLGGEQFMGAQSGGGTSFARGQHEGLTFPTIAVICYDVCGGFIGAAPTAQNLGSFSLQPEPNSAAPALRSYIQLNTWVDINAPTNWNANYLPYDAAGVQIAQPGFVAGSEWQNLSINHWYRLTTTVDFVQNRITQVSITDLTTSSTATASPQGWYLGGGSASTLAIPTGVRFFVGGGAGNVMGFDNFCINQPTPVCPCDWTHDSTLNSQDFFDFLGAFFADQGDFNHDNTTNSQDFFDFLGCFFTGC